MTDANGESEGRTIRSYKARASAFPTWNKRRRYVYEAYSKRRLVSQLIPLDGGRKPDRPNAHRANDFRKDDVNTWRKS